MSALRFSRPGIAGTTLIDLGPQEVRSQGHRFYLLSELTATRSFAPAQPVRAGRTIKKQPYTGPRCGHLLPNVGQPCFRRPHPGRDHRSEAAVKADIQRRREGRNV